MITKSKKGYRVESKKGKNLGDFRSRLEAVRRLGQVEYFKKHKRA